MKKILIGVFLTISISLFSQVQEKNLNKGFRVNVQGEQLGITMPFFFDNALEIAPSISVIHAEKIGTDLGLGVSLRKYVHKAKVSPFVGLRGGALWYIPEEEDAIIDYVFGILGGVEYFFDQHFSVGIECQLNCTISDEYSLRFGNPERTNYNTASAVSLSIYW